MHRFKKHWWGMISSVILIAFTGYMLMDTFLLTKVYVVADDKKENKSDNDTENERSRKLFRQGQRTVTTTYRLR
ncbi:MAG: hypothetical protein ACLTUL_20375 [Blautia faecis]